MNDNVVRLHAGVKTSKSSTQAGKAYVPITALLYAIVIFGGLQRDPEKLGAVRDVFAAGVIVDPDSLTALVPATLADWIDEFSPALYGQAAAACQMMNFTECSALEACRAVLNKE